MSEWDARSDLEDGDRLQPHHTILDGPDGRTIDPPETFKGGAGDDTFTGGSGDDQIQGGAGNDTLNGGNGNDTIEGGAGDDVLTGGGKFNSYDTLTYAHAQAGITLELFDTSAQDTGGAGIDTVKGFAGLIGSDHDDDLSITGSESHGLPGPPDLARTAAAPDGLHYAFGLYTLDGGAGNDTLDAAGTSGSIMVDGGPGDDVLTSTNSNNWLTYEDAPAGVRVDLSQTAAQDTGGAGVDQISGFHWLQGTNFADTLTGTSGNDFLAAGRGDDVLDGGAGNDQFETQSGAATITGGAGDDTYHLGDARDVIVEAPGGGYDRVLIQGSYTLSDNVEFLQVQGHSRASVVVGTGNDQDNTIQDRGDDQFHLIGLGGDDHLIEHSGGGRLDGGAGNDTLNDVFGHDTLIGGSGNDVFIVTSGSGVIVEAVDGGVDLVKTFHDFTLPDNVENLDMSGSGVATGNDLDNVIRASSIGSVIDGEGGDDTMVGGGHAVATYVDAPSAVTVDLSIRGAQDTGGAGSDKLVGIAGLIGSAFDDALSGAAGANSLSGGDGADTLVGRGGADVLAGGAGANVFRYEAVADSTASAADRITDLTSADHIDLSKIDADTTHKGNQAFTLVSAFDHHAGELTVSFDAGTGKTTISGDVNGDGVADLVITADGDHHDFTGFVL